MKAINASGLTASNNGPGVSTSLGPYCDVFVLRVEGWFNTALFSLFSLFYTRSFSLRQMKMVARRCCPVMLRLLRSLSILVSGVDLWVHVVVSQRL